MPQNPKGLLFGDVWNILTPDQRSAISLELGVSLGRLALTKIRAKSPPNEDCCDYCKGMYAIRKALNEDLW